MSNRLFPNANELLDRYSHNYKFEDFQKSEMIITEGEDDHFKYKLYSTIQGNRIIVLKEEQTRI